MAEDALVEEEETVESVAEETEAPPDQPVREWSDEDAEEAKAFGWKDPDEWEGEKPAGYIEDPRRFMERAENFTPFRKMRERLEAEKTQMEERFRKLESISTKALDAQRAAFERDMAAIRAGQRAAVDSGDAEQYDALERQRTELETKREKFEAPPPAKEPQVPPEVIAYRTQNDWAQDPVLWKQAVDAVNYMPGLETATPAEQLQYAESKIRDLYPHKFQSGAVQKARPKVDGGGLGAAKKTGFSTLPDEAKQAFRRFVDQGLFKDDDKSRQEYFNEYQRT